ncbi:TPA: hypothetical protein ACI7G4_000916 [Escherichia coli]|uniref:hypothetical protein n=1 Tax=Escherichia coli TaxID=562 RepID=UPI00210C7D8B|nr:hypothetical protein [Escherichia coli]
METNKKYALIQDGVVINIILWDWDGSEENDIFKDFEKALLDDSDVVGVGCGASKDSSNNWSFTMPDSEEI